MTGLGIWVELVPYGMALTGYIPAFLVADDPRPAAVQFDERYVYGGWCPFRGMTMDPESHVMTFPDDPPYKPVALTVHQPTNETVVVYRHGLVAIIQEDGNFEVARMD